MGSDDDSGRDSRSLATRDDDRPVLAVTGGTGFIGSCVTRVAGRGIGGWLARPVSRFGGPGTVNADIRDRRATLRALEGSHALVHAASYIGGDAALCEEINVGGTENVVAAAKACGIGRLVYVSTAAVYGRGPFELVTERAARISPASALSSSRAVAERIVLDAGGAVVRPHLVLGPGDRWVGSGILALTSAIEGLVDGGTAVHSVIDVADLAEAIVGLSAAASCHGAYHVANSRPVSVCELVSELRGAGVFLPTGQVRLAEAEDRVGHSVVLQNALRLLSVDHSFDSSRLARDAGIVFRMPFRLSGSARAWYGETLGSQLA
ncbi:NAD-dependent epimerase/dehydratase family protein [Luethyella okanaganae]